MYFLQPLTETGGCVGIRAQVRAHILTIPGVLQGLCSELDSEMQPPFLNLSTGAGAASSTNNSSVLPRESVVDPCTLTEAASQARWQLCHTNHPIHAFPLQMANMQSFLKARKN